jgi:hypothetical protein
MTRAERNRAKYAQLLAELRNDPALLTEITAILREHGYQQSAQIGEAAEDFVWVWRLARQRRQAAG